MERPDDVEDILRVLFSGRFDDAHLGHWATILKLSKLFDSVLVVVLDYPERQKTAKYVQRVFETLRILSGIPEDSIQITTNKTHFAQLSKAEWLRFECDVYAGGNEQVNDHMTDLGIQVYNAERSFDYSARDYRKEPIMNKN